MMLTEHAMRKKTVSWMVTLLLIVGGVIAFLGLGRLEDPEFTIKEAVVVTPYPGASAREVEEEITLPIENIIQQLPYVDNIQSISSAGLSQVTVEMQSHHRKDDLAQIWDEMRRKIRDMETTLPPGAGIPQINDDFGDVYGIFAAVTGDGYTYEDIANYVDFLRRELVLIDGVGKVSVGGRRSEQVILEVNRAKMSALNTPLSSIQVLLNRQNLVSDAGNIQVGSEYIRISSTGAYNDVEDLKHLMLGQANGKVIYLSDVANVKRVYAEPASHLYRHNGKPALTIGISFSSGVNVVDVGNVVQNRIQALEYARPIGIKVGLVYDQPSQVDRSVSDFLVSLLQAVGIVIVVLLVAMGLRSGMMMSLVLLLTILATFIVMNIFGINLHRISLGALIIALGMLVDNAIVITEGILIGMKRGFSCFEAAKKIVSQTVWPLLGATVISITAFAPIGLSPDQSGEFTGSLFWVLFISLLLSWVIAITLTPFFASIMFRDSKGDVPEDADVDPYKGVFYQAYKALLFLSLRSRWATSALVAIAFGASVYGFGFVSQAFFPPSNLPVFTVDYWLPEGSDIRATAKDMAELEAEILRNEDVKKITSTVGQGSMRFMLTYQGERHYDSYGQFIIEVDNFEKVAPTRQWVDNLIREHAPQAFSKSDRFFVGPSTKAKIEARISGPDSQVLRRLAEQVMDIFHNDPDAVNIRHDWRERTKVLRPQYTEAEARRLGITRADLNNALEMNVSGVEIGLFRDGSTLLPILARPPEHERSNIALLEDIQVFSPALNNYIDIEQVIHGMNVEWEDPLIMRRDRKRTVQIWADPNPYGAGNSFDLFKRLQPQVDAIELPPGYALEWGGEHESQLKANNAVFRFVPLGIIVMIATTVLLFNSAKQTIVVWLTVPLSIVGVTIGLLSFNLPFSFTALLGFLSLTGMVLKNGIVLIEEIKRLSEEDGQPIHDAIAGAAIGRLRPVVMAAITTVLGLIPLLSDVFFAPLAVTIMFGLGFATVLTLIVVPVMFALFYGVRFHRSES